MRRTITWLSAGATLLILVAVSSADEEKVPVDKVPKVVMDTVKARFKEAKVIGAGKEDEDGKPVYEVTIMDKGAHIDVTLTPEGELLMIERAIAAKDLPKAVTKALDEKYPKGTYRKVEEIISVDKKTEKLKYYEVLLVKADKSALEVQVTAEGKVVNEEKKGPGKDDD